MAPRAVRANASPGEGLARLLSPQLLLLVALVWAAKDRADRLHRLALAERLTGEALPMAEASSCSLGEEHGPGRGPTIVAYRVEPSRLRAAASSSGFGALPGPAGSGSSWQTVAWRQGAATGDELRAVENLLGPFGDEGSADTPALLEAAQRARAPVRAALFRPGAYWAYSAAWSRGRRWLYAGELYVLDPDAGAVFVVYLH